MNTYISVLLLAAFLLAPFAADVHAYTFTDSAKYFGQHSGYTLENGDPWGGIPSLPNKDVNGLPDIRQGTFVYDGTVLDEIILNIKLPKRYNSNYNSNLWGGIEPGDWFFDFNQDAKWDIIIHKELFEIDRGSISSQWGVYDVSGLGLDIFVPASGALSDYYTLSESPANTMPRKNQPVGIDPNFIPGYTTDIENETPPVTRVGSANVKTDITNKSGRTIATVDDWLHKDEISRRYLTVTWDILGDVVDIYAEADGSASFTYAFTVSCANDVIYGEDAPVPTPEPASLTLMALGAAALAAARSRRRKNERQPASHNEA